MLLYEDILTGDEMFSDAFPIKEVDGVVYEVEGRLITVGSVDVDIGANPSAEEATEALDENSKQVINIVENAQLQDVGKYEKKAYLTYLKEYMKAVKAKLQEEKRDAKEIEAFEKGAQSYAKKILANLKDYDFFTGSSQDPSGMLVLLNYREDGITPYFTFWKHGLKERKL